MILPLRSDIPGAGRSWCVYLILAVTAAVFLWQRFEPEPLRIIDIHIFGVTPRAILQGKSLETLISYMFMHSGWWHILANLWTFWIFGAGMERLTGFWRFLGFYLVCGIVAALVESLLTSAPEIPIVGASGAIAGVMGGYLIRYPRSKVLTFVFFLFLNIPAYVFMLVWILFQLLYGMTQGPGNDVAWWAHLGGFVCGCLILPIFERGKNPRDYHRNNTPIQRSILLPPSKRRDG